MKVTVYEQVNPLDGSVTASFAPFSGFSTVSVDDGPETLMPPQSKRAVEVPKGSTLVVLPSGTVLLSFEGELHTARNVISSAELGRRGFRFLD